MGVHESTTGIHKIPWKHCERHSGYARNSEARVLNVRDAQYITQAELSASGSFIEVKMTF